MQDKARRRPERLDEKRLDERGGDLFTLASIF